MNKLPELPKCYVCNEQIYEWEPVNWPTSDSPILEGYLAHATCQPRHEGPPIIIKEKKE